MKCLNGACPHLPIMRAFPGTIGSSQPPRNSKAFRNFVECYRLQRTRKVGRFIASGWRSKSDGTTTIRLEIWGDFATSFSAPFDWLSIPAFTQSIGPANRQSHTCVKKPEWVRKKLSLKSNVTLSRRDRGARTKSEC